jgi:parvulin-like peptidyl-prolyl isomerase
MFRGINFKNQIPAIGIGAVLGGLAVFMGTSAAGCGKGDEVAILVNGEAISMTEFTKFMELKPQVTLQLAQDKKISPTDMEIQKELDFRDKLQKNFLLALTDRGLTLPMIRKSIKIDLIQERLLTEGIKVTEDDVKKFIQDNKDRFVEPARGEVYWILVYDEPTRKKVDESLKGLNFPQVASRYSKDPKAKDNNGRIFDANTGRDPALASLPAEVASVTEGGTTAWVRVSQGWAKFQVKKKLKEKAIVPNEAHMEAIRRELAKNRGAAARNIDQMILAKLVKSDIQIKLPNYDEPWKRIIAAYKEEGNISDLTGGKR